MGVDSITQTSYWQDHSTAISTMGFWLGTLVRPIELRVSDLVALMFSRAGFLPYPSGRYRWREYLQSDREQGVRNINIMSP
jgi:hypothetical protein